MASAYISCSGRSGDTVIVPLSGGTYTLNFRIQGKAPNGGAITFNIWELLSYTKGLKWTVGPRTTSHALDGTITGTCSITVTFPSSSSIGPNASITWRCYCYIRNSSGNITDSAIDTLTLKFLTPTTTVSPSSLSLSWASGTLSFNVSDSGGATVNVSSYPSWMKKTGDYTFTYEENTSDFEREGSIQFKGSSTATVSIKQLKAPGLSTEQSSVGLPSVGGSATVPIIVEGGAGTISIENTSDWLTAYMSGSNLVVSAPRNAERYSLGRNVTVTLRGSNSGICSVKVYQSGPVKVRYTSLEGYGDLVVTPSDSWITVDNTNMSITSSSTGVKSGKVNFNYSDLPAESSADLTVNLSR